MIFLAIETSQRDGSVAVRDDSGRVHAEALRPGVPAGDDLVAAIDRLFARTGVAPRGIRAIGVSVGPGGFTGLRTAVATLQAKAPDELEPYRQLVLGIATAVAEAKGGVVPSEDTAIGLIREALGVA